MIRQLPPFLTSIGKRQVKSPKIYIRDSGLFHALSGIHALLKEATEHLLPIPLPIRMLLPDERIGGDGIERVVVRRT